MEQKILALLRAIPMHHLHPVLRGTQTFGHIFGDHDGAVLAAGATEGDGQIALAFMNVMRQQVDEQVEMRWINSFV